MRKSCNRFLLGVLAGAGVALLAVLGFSTSSITSEVHADPNREAELDRKMLDYTGRVFEAVSQLASPAVVYVEAKVKDPNGKVTAEESGSGILIRPTGLGRPIVVTNYHVVGKSRPEEIELYLADGRMVRPTRLLLDEETDIALLDPEETDLPAIRMGDSDKARIGQWVLAIGSPFGLAQSVTHGIISAKNRRQVGLPSSLRIREFLQTDAAINPGSSGGPLINLDGELLGINTAIATRTGSSSGVGFSIPVNLVRWVVDELLTHGKVRRAFLGVEFPTRFEPSKARQLGLPFARGALVAHVHERTPAAEAGLLAEDVVLQFDGIPIQDDNHLINVVSKTPVGRDVLLRVWRQKNEIELRARLISWEAFQQAEVPRLSPVPATAPPPSTNTEQAGRP